MPHPRGSPLKEGDSVQGVVKSVKDHGVFLTATWVQGDIFVPEAALKKFRGTELSKIRKGDFITGELKLSAQGWRFEAVSSLVQQSADKKGGHGKEKGA